MQKTHLIFSMHYSVHSTAPSTQPMQTDVDQLNIDFHRVRFQFPVHRTLPFVFIVKYTVNHQQKRETTLMQVWLFCFFFLRKQGILGGNSDETDTLVLMSVHCSLHPFVA